MESLDLILRMLPLLLEGMWVTLQIAVVAACIGLIGGVGIGILNCDKVEMPRLQRFLRAFVWMVRGTPSFVQLLLIYYALPSLLGINLPAFVAGVLALGLNSTAYVSEIVRGGINSLAQGQWEAAYVLGVSRKKTFQGIILPQMFRSCLPALTNELTTLIKETSILMMIGVAELTKVSKDIVLRELSPMSIYLTAAVLYLVMTSSVAFITQKLQERMR